MRSLQTQSRQCRVRDEVAYHPRKYALAVGLRSLPLVKLILLDEIREMDVVFAMNLHLRALQTNKKSRPISSAVKSFEVESQLPRINLALGRP